MNPLIFFSVAGVAGLGLGLWQQSALDSANAEVERLGRNLVELRDAAEADRAEIASGRSRLRQMRGTLRQLKEQEAAVAGEFAARFTPEQEGWWPENRSYCYLPKSSLSQVRFGETSLTQEEADALLKRKMAAIAPGTTATVVGAGRDPQGRFSYEFHLFDEAGLNPDAAALLGLDAAEQRSVWETYQGLFRSVRALEASRAIRVDPPEPISADKPDHLVVARIPVLTDESQPLVEAAEKTLSESLGMSRVGILSSLVRDYAEGRLDQMGAVPREFVRYGNQLQVKVGYGFKWEPLTLGGLKYGYGNPVEYAHLFGPGAPC